MQRQCSGITKGGARCRAFALPGSTFCIAHDPNKVTELAEFRRRGGRGRSNTNRARRAVADLRAIPDVQNMLIEAFKDVRNGKLEPTVGTAMATISNAITKLASLQTIVEIQRRQEEMAQEIAELREGRPA